MPLFFNWLEEWRMLKIFMANGLFLPRFSGTIFNHQSEPRISHIPATHKPIQGGWGDLGAKFQQRNVDQQKPKMPGEEHKRMRNYRTLLPMPLLKNFLVPWFANKHTIRNSGKRPTFRRSPYIAVSVNGVHYRLFFDFRRPSTIVIPSKLVTSMLGKDSRKSLSH